LSKHLKAACLIEQAAQLGHPEAFFLQGDFKERGITTEVDLYEALRLYGEAATAARPDFVNMPQLYQAAVCKIEEVGANLFSQACSAYGDLDMDRALKLFQDLRTRARGLEHVYKLPARALTLESRIRWFHSKTVLESEEAQALLSEAARLGDPLAECIIAEQQMIGLDVDGASIGFQTVLLISVRPNPPAGVLLILARAYELGLGTNPDEKRAALWRADANSNIQAHDCDYLDAVKIHPARLSVPPPLRDIFATRDDAEFQQKLTELIELGTDSGYWNVLQQLLAWNINKLSVCERACVALAELGSKTSDGSKIASFDGIEAVLRCFQRHPDSETVCRAVCGVIGCRALMADFASQSAPFGFVEAILECLRRHIDVPDVCLPACGALLILASNGENAIKIASLGGIEDVLKCLQQHGDSQDLCNLACGAIRYLAVNADNRIKIASLGGIEALLACLRRHTESQDVSEHVCGAIRRLASGLISGVCSEIELGGIEAVLMCLQHHADSKAVCEQACAAIGNFSSSAYQESKIASLGGIDALLKCLRRHTDSKEVGAMACGALWNLAGNDDHRIKIASLGGIEAVLKCLQDHAQSRDLCQYACAVIGRLANNADNQVKIASFDGIEAVLRSLELHADSEDVCRSACYAVSILARNTDSQIKIASLGGIDAVLKCLQQHLESQDVCEAACDAIWVLAVNADNQIKFASLGGIEAVFNCLQRHSDALGVCESVCGFLTEATSLPKGVRMSALGHCMETLRRHHNLQVFANAVLIDTFIRDDESGGFRTACSIMAFDPTNPRVIVQSFFDDFKSNQGRDHAWLFAYGMRSLTFHPLTVAATCAVSSDIIDQLLLVMGDPETWVDAIFQAACALEQLCRDERSRAYLLKTNGSKLIVSLVENYPRAIFSEPCVRILTSLLRDPSCKVHTVSLIDSQKLLATRSELLPELKRLVEA